MKTFGSCTTSPHRNSSSAGKSEKRRADLPSLDRIASDFPDLKIIGAHTGWPSGRGADFGLLQVG